MCSVTKSLLTNGVEFDAEGVVIAPSIECSHYGRLRLLNENIDNIRCCYHLYQTIPPENFDIPEERAIYALSVGLEDYVRANIIRKRLATA